LADLLLLRGALTGSKSDGVSSRSSGGNSQYLS
jgi:hypothetical protein